MSKYRFSKGREARLATGAAFSMARDSADLDADFAGQIAVDFDGRFAACTRAARSTCDGIPSLIDVRLHPGYSTGDVTLAFIDELRIVSPSTHRDDVAGISNAISAYPNFPRFRAMHGRRARVPVIAESSVEAMIEAGRNRYGAGCVYNAVRHAHPIA
jgi:hypothetical protein